MDVLEVLKNVRKKKVILLIYLIQMYKFSNFSCKCYLRSVRQPQWVAISAYIWFWNQIIEDATLNSKWRLIKLILEKLVRDQDCFGIIRYSD
jgi:hypothetical protein